MNPITWLNTAWMLKSAAESWAFRRATRAVAATQARVLTAMLRNNGGTDFGRTHGFGRIHSPRDFQAQVPLSVHEDYAPAIARIAGGEPNVLTADRVELLEPTSGTTGGEKWIPYTASLRRQFQRAVAAWIANLFWHRPALRQGRAYWSISPALGGTRRTAAGIPIGFDEDSAYLGTLDRLALKQLLVVPPEVARLAHLEAFRYCTLLHLLRAADLSLISVWSPTFLTALLTRLEVWQDRLLADLRQGTVHPPVPIPQLDAARLKPRRPEAARATFLSLVLGSQRPLAEKLQQIWPGLALISCWADAGASRYLPALRNLFPTVAIQPKGLLATEGCVTFPLEGCAAPALAIRSHFFEFQEPGGVCRLAHQLDCGGRYRTVLTTGGGLYRYQLHDEVEVVGFVEQCPLLRFLGKADRVSDLVGEKLAEGHVGAVLDRLFRQYGLTPRFALVVPVDGQPARYRLYLQDEQANELPTLRGLAADLEVGLCENPHYGYAVGLGQLAPAEVELLSPWGEPGWQVYERRCLALGQRAGNIKPTALDARMGWAKVFQAEGEPISDRSGVSDR